MKICARGRVEARRGVKKSAASGSHKKKRISFCVDSIMFRCDVAQKRGKKAISPCPYVQK